MARLKVSNLKPGSGTSLKSFGDCCYAPWSSLAALHKLMLRSISPLPCLWVWCCALWPSLELWTGCCALRPLIFTCQSSWTCAPWSALAVLNELDAMALVSDLHLQFYMNVLLRSIIATCGSTWICCCAVVFPCNSTWTPCNALWSSLACLHELDAALRGLHLQFFMNLGLTLRSRIFACISLILACIPTHLDATHCDLHLHFFMNLTLRSMIST